jgi:hypothetical protein
VQPFVYNNSDDAQTYKSHNYQLGHWIGSNSDIFYLSYRQNILRGLGLRISGWYFRKGQTEEPVQQYQLPYPQTLYGSRRTEKKISIIVFWQPFHNLYFRGYYNYSDISDEKERRTPGFMIGIYNNFSCSIYYGI